MTREEMNDDLISRKAVLKPYKDLKDDDTISVWLIRKNIEQQSSINTQQPKFIVKSDGTIEQIKNHEDRKKGHWIPYLKEGLIVKCSECESRFSLGYNFCPNCGADMRGGINETGR